MYSFMGKHQYCRCSEVTKRNHSYAGRVDYVNTGYRKFRFVGGQGRVNMKNRCYTYFRIVGQFNTDDISNILNLTPKKKWDIGDARPNGSRER